MRFTFSRRDAGQQASSYDLGDLDLAGAGGEATSRGRQPDQSFMVYIGIIELVYRVSRLVTEGGGPWEFVGPDSSFIVWFRPARRGRLSVSVDGAVLGEEPAAAVLDGLRDGIHEFQRDPLNVLPPGERLADDVRKAVERLDALSAGR
jgi:hypothetical protein